MGQLLYFAYGSNLCVPRLKARTPSCQVVGKAILPAYHLRFHKIGRDGSAKCDAYYTGDPDHQVEGVLYRIDIIERPVLDEAEDLGRGYDSHQVVVESEQGKIHALTYRARPEMIDTSLAPFCWYHSYVIDGARHHRLSQDYIKQLEQVAVAMDGNAERVALNQRVLANFVES